MPRFAANISTLFCEQDFLDRFGAAKAAGFDAVECWFPHEYPRHEIETRLCDLQLTMVGINSDHGAGAEWGLAALPGREADFLASIDIALECAAAFGNSAVHVMAGGRAGRRAGDGARHLSAQSGTGCPPRRRHRNPAFDRTAQQP